MADFPSYVKAYQYRGGFNKFVYDKLKELDPSTQTFTVSGTVTDGSSPLSGAVVSAGSKTSTTGEDGTYSIAGLEAGSYNLTCVLEGFSFDGESIEVSADMTKDIEMTPTTFKITCSVKDSSSSEGVQGAVVLLTDKVESSITFTGTTGSAGGCTINNVPAGTYIVTATAEGYENYEATEDLVVDSDESCNISMTLSSAD